VCCLLKRVDGMILSPRPLAQGAACNNTTGARATTNNDKAVSEEL